MNPETTLGEGERRRRRRRSSSTSSAFASPSPRASSGRRGAAPDRWAPLAWLVAAPCLLLALYLAAIHPLGAGWAVPAVLLVALLARYFWTTWPGWMLALVPLIGLAPWTGWLWLEEWDLLVLASAAGGYAAWAGPHRHTPPPVQAVWRRALRWRASAVALMVLAAAATALSVFIGVTDAGGLDLYVYQGYWESGQALRAGKPVLALLLMLPLWHRAATRAPQTLTPALGAGLCGVLLVVSLGALWERLAFTGFSNFSTDYRTTSVFWEMHVGGAALDGALALSLPFGLLALLRARGRLGFAWAMGLLLLGLYALITTFSRGLYLAAALALPLTLALWMRQQSRAQAAPAPAPGAVWPAAPAQALMPPGRSLFGLGLLVALGAAVAWQMFPNSGYRGLLAVSGAMVALMLQPVGHAGGDRRERLLGWGLGLVMAVPLVGLGALLATWVNKLAYGLYALAWLLSVVLARAAWSGRHPWRTPLGDSLRAMAWLTTVGLAGVVAWNWGGMPAVERAWLPLLVLSLAWPLSQGGSVGQVLGQLGWRPRMLAVGAVLGASAIVAALAGGSYIAERSSTVSQDLDGRFAHWSRGLAMADVAGGEWIGVGAGRYLPHFANNAPVEERIGDVRFLGGTPPRVALSAGRHTLGWGEMLRLTQRVNDAPPGLRLRVLVRNPLQLKLLGEVCERHLIYTEACRTRQAELPASEGFRWVTLELGGNGELGQRGWPKRGLALSLAVETPGTKVEIAGVSLQGSDGRELLKNGGFEDGMAHWFFSSDRHHLPWHAKSLPLHWYFEQGGIGLVLSLGLWALALGRVSWGNAAGHPLAPALAGALLGFMLVGLFDSLVDGARLAFLYGTLVCLGLGLRTPPPPAVPVPPPPEPASA